MWEERFELAPKNKAVDAFFGELVLLFFDVDNANRDDLRDLIQKHRIRRVTFDEVLRTKNVEVERLIAEIARLTGETKTEAVRKALEERREKLRLRVSGKDRAARLRRFLEQEAWPSVPAAELGRTLSRQEEEALLGYGEDGV